MTESEAKALLAIEPQPFPDSDRHEMLAYRKQICSWLQEGNDTALDHEANRARQTMARFNSGAWMLDQFFVAIDDYSVDAKNADSRDNELRLITAWLSRNPGSLNAKLARIEAMIGWAWDARGYGWAKDVTEPNMMLFLERLEKAAKWMIEIGSSGDQCPRVWMARLRLSRGLGAADITFHDMSDIATTKFPGYVPLYCETAYSLLPRWYGKPGDWELWLSTAVKKLDATAADEVYAEVVADMLNMGLFDPKVDGRLFSKVKADWPRMKRGLKSLMEKRPDSTWLPTIYLLAAGEANDPKAAWEIYSTRLKGHYDSSVYTTPQSFKESIIEWFKHRQVWR